LRTATQGVLKGERRATMRNRTAPLLIGLAALVASCDGAGLREGRDPTTPSGFPVPRYVSLKFNEVNARSGPSDDNRILWTYKAAGLPVQIVAETTDWRRICDPAGGIAWVKKSQIDGTRRVMSTAAIDIALRGKPAHTAEATAFLRPRSIVDLDKCDEGWCRLDTGKSKGWAEAGALWGVDPKPQCKGLPAPKA